MNEQFNDPNLGVSIIAIHWAEKEAHGSRSFSWRRGLRIIFEFDDRHSYHHAMGRFDQAIFVDHKGKDPILGPGTRCSGKQFRNKAIDPSVTGEREAKCRNSKRLA